jgi:hypothetical protein
MVADRRLWRIGELQSVVVRLMHDGTATASLLRVLVERNWPTSSPFALCSSAEFAKLVCPSDLKRIGNRAFCGCWRLTQMVIPSSVRRIGYRAFSGCASLTGVGISSKVATIDGGAFQGCSRLAQVVLPLGLTTIPDGIFDGCSGLMLMAIPPRVTSIKACAFLECSGLRQVEIPPSVTIEYWAFTGCSNLVRVVIPSSFVKLDEDVFHRVTRIECLTLIGSPLSPAVVSALDHCLTPTAKVTGAALAGQRFGRFTIVGT